jgi:hypothetical protein
VPALNAFVVIGLVLGAMVLNAFVVIDSIFGLLKLLGR